MSRYMWRKYRQKQTKFILGAVYIHPNVPQEAIEYFMFQMFGTYPEAIRLIFPNMNPDTESPILLCGDFNMNIMQNKSFVNFMKSKFNLDYISSASTALGNTCVDLTFTRNISVQTLPYVSYFSYYRPVLNRLMLSSEQ
jgi:endonuclease/exonuclease/phosphatase family metal-dependent hydrolase